MATADSVQRSVAAADSEPAPARRASYVPRHAAAQFAATAGTFTAGTTKADSAVQRAGWAGPDPRRQSKSTVVDFAINTTPKIVDEPDTSGRRFSYKPGDAARRNSQRNQQSSIIGQWTPQLADEPVVRRASYVPGDAAKRRQASAAGSTIGKYVEVDDQPNSRRTSYVPGDAAKRNADRSRQNSVDSEPFFDGMYTVGDAPKPDDDRSRRSSTLDPLSPINSYTPGDGAKLLAARRSSGVAPPSHQATLRRASYKPGDAAKRLSERNDAERRRQSSVSHVLFDNNDGTYGAENAARRSSVAHQSWISTASTQSRHSSVAESLSPSTSRHSGGETAGDAANRRNAESRRSSVAEPPVSPSMGVFTPVAWSNALPSLEESTADQNFVSEPPRTSSDSSKGGKMAAKRQSSFLRYTFNSGRKSSHDSVTSTHVSEKGGAGPRGSTTGSERRDSGAHKLDLKQRKSSNKSHDRVDWTQQSQDDDSEVELDTLQASPAHRDSLSQTQEHREHALMALEGTLPKPPPVCEVPEPQTPPSVADAVKIIKDQEKAKRRQTLTSFIQGY